MSLITSTQLDDFLPHRPPFVMVSELLTHSKDTARAFLKIREDNVLLEDNLFSEAGLLEFMAQTLALHSGYLAKDSNDEANAVGVIGAVKNFQVLHVPKVGETIYCDINILSEFMSMTLAEASVYDNNETLVAKAELKTARSE